MHTQEQKKQFKKKNKGKNIDKNKKKSLHKRQIKENSQISITSI